MSMNPGTSQVIETPQPIIGGSQTLNPPTPLEYGRTVSGGIQNDATAGSTLPI